MKEARDLKDLTIHQVQPMRDEQTTLPSSTLPLPRKDFYLKAKEGLLPESQGPNLAVTVLRVPFLLEKGQCARPTSPACRHTPYYRDNNTRNSTSYTLRPTPETQRTKPNVRHPTPENQHPKPRTRNSTPETQRPKPNTRNSTPETPHPKPHTRNHTPETPQTKLHTRNPKP